MKLRRTAFLGAVPLLVAAGLVAVRPSNVHAIGGDNFVVDTAADFTNANNTPGVCSGAGANAIHCSLRAAVQQEDADGGGTITISAGISPALTLVSPANGPDDGTTGDIHITQPITITGQGSGRQGSTSTTIDASAVHDRAFEVDNFSGNSTIQGVHITGGDAPAAPNVSQSTSTDGGGILEDDMDPGTLTLTDVFVTNSSGTNGGGVADEGGGLTVNGLYLGSGNTDGNTAVANNQNASGDGGGLYVNLDGESVESISLTNVSAIANTAQSFCAKGGGGVGVVGTLAGPFSLTNATLENNSTGDGECGSGEGGGLSFDVTGVGSNPVAAVASNLTVSGNTADEGGGIFAQIGSSGGTIAISKAALVSNDASNSNGGGDGGGIDIGRGATLDQAFVSGNTAGASGGGVYFTSGNATGGGTVQNTTVSGNTASSQGIGDGVAIGFSRTGLLQESTVAGNNPNGTGRGMQLGAEQSTDALTLADDIVGLPHGHDTDCGGAAHPLSSGYNVVTDSSCLLGGTGDLQGVDPQLTLVSSGLPAWQQHYSIASTSPARDHVPTASCPVRYDQLGTVRPQGPACDSGSFELQLVASTPTPTPTPTGAPAGTIQAPAAGGGPVSSPASGAIPIASGLLILGFTAPMAVRRRRGRTRAPGSRPLRGS
ncbi:MAG TPA: choice-of-anchor Q domain-containing protein [Candidatus Dormibacteraeota bacterium]|nr:choice-of-anchor Q domain-containing protein [Candidatus Dormibacteraeota bacterium]